MGRKKSKRLPDVYFIAPNGMKLKLFGKNSVFKPFALDMLQQDIATECKLPKDMLFPDKKLVEVTIHEPRMDVALADELNAKGSINVTFKYGDFKCDEVSK